VGLRFLLAGALLAASTACGSPERPTSVDVEALEAAIPASLVPEHPEAVTVVVCPEIAVDGLGPVSCTAIVAGVDVLVKVTRPDRLDQMEVSAAVSLVRATDVADEVGGRLAADLGGVDRVTCEPAVRVAVAGQEFACTVVDPKSRAHRFVATLHGPSGSFGLELVPKG
tara:strand:- start:587 stop:1093 length:507 start_codon:yes stop_codon:yes gene_type:complete